MGRRCTAFLLVVQLPKVRVYDNNSFNLRTLISLRQWIPLSRWSKSILNLTFVFWIHRVPKYIGWSLNHWINICILDTPHAEVRRLILEPLDHPKLQVLRRMSGAIGPSYRTLVSCLFWFLGDIDMVSYLAHIDELIEQWWERWFCVKLSGTNSWHRRELSSTSLM